MKLRIISDTHGQRKEYLDLIKDCDYSIHCGDLDFSYDWLPEMPNHKHFLGNHDNYDAPKHPNNLGDFGKINFLPIDINGFFIRGAWSIDWKGRIPKVSWWEQEQLTQEQLDKCLQEYIKQKPNIVFSHDCPFNILLYMNLRLEFAKSFGYNSSYIPSRTNLALQKMLEEHRPKIWLHGHYHQKFDQIIDGTRFICITTDFRYKEFKCLQYFDLRIYKS